MNEPILGAILAILAADITILLAYVVTISSKFDEYTNERRNLLDHDFLMKVNEVKNTDTKIDVFLPLFKEHGEIETWKNKVSQVYEYTIYSFIFTFIGLFVSLLNMNQVQGVTPEVLSIIAGGFFTLWIVLQIASLGNEMRKWKQNQKTNQIKKE